MKTVLLCILCLVVGAVGGAAIGAYAMKNVHERWVAFYLAGGLTLIAMQAEQIKMGEAALLLQSFERTIPNLVVALDENGVLRNGSMSADTALMAVKRFYVCTNTDIPDGEIPVSRMMIDEPNIVIAVSRRKAPRTTAGFAGTIDHHVFFNFDLLKTADDLFTH